MTSEQRPQRGKIEQVKSWLQRYGELENEVDGLIGRIEGLRATAQSATISHIDGMPRGGGFSGDRIGASVGRIDQLERECRSKIQEGRQVYNEISGAISQIKTNRRRGWPDRAAVLEMRYLDLASWLEIVKMLFGQKDDFEDRRDSYLRRCHKLHGAALSELTDILHIDGFLEGDNKNVL